MSKSTVLPRTIKYMLTSGTEQECQAKLITDDQKIRFKNKS